MSARNALLEAPPHAVENSLKELGGRLRLARLRRNLTVDDVAKKVGVGRCAVMGAEKGTLSTGIATHAGLLWAFGLLKDLDAVAESSRDSEGLVLARRHDRDRARTSTQLDNDF